MKEVPECCKWLLLIKEFSKISCLLNKYPGASQHLISKFICARMCAGRKESSTRLCLTSWQCCPATGSCPALQTYTAAFLLLWGHCSISSAGASCLSHCSGKPAVLNIHVQGRGHSSGLQVTGERAKLLWCVRSFACSTQTVLSWVLPVPDTAGPEQKAWNFYILVQSPADSSTCHSREGSCEGFKGWKASDLTDAPEKAMDSGSEELFVNAQAPMADR